MKKRLISMKRLWLAGAVVAACGCATAPRPVRQAEPYRPDEERSVRVAVAKPLEEAEPRAAAAVAPAAAGVDTTPAAPSPAVPATAAPAERKARVLRPGDQIEISLQAIPQPVLLRHVIDEQGRVNLPFIGAIEIAGLSSAEAEKKIETAYIEGKIYKVITVIIVPPESEYFVQGEVLNPGRYPLTREITLSMALARAGRYTEYANAAKVRIIRGNQIIDVNARRIQEGRDEDIAIQPGDVIVVPRSAF